MGFISSHFVYTLLLLLPHFLGIISQDCPCQLSPSASPLPSPSQQNLIFLGQTLCSCPLSPLPSPPQQSLIFLDQRLAVAYPVIQRFKNTITSDPFNITQTWVGPNICNYKGFFCDNPPDNLTAIAVSAIDFNGFLLEAPTLTGFIDQLLDLAIFHANTNRFSGTISPKIALLPYLYEFDISNNIFFGAFPLAILQISSLTFLDIRYNSFNGTLPPQVFMQFLDALFLNNNKFMQTLPTNLGSTPALYLTLANNKFTGPIPKNIGNASSTLTEILFLNNLLSGCLPYEIGFLREITVFDVGKNILTGPLPCSMGCLQKAELLNFADNFFYGQVPEVVCELQNLSNFTLSNNYFTRVGPNCTRLIKNGILDVKKNCIPGLSDQRSPKECGLFFLHLRPCAYSPSSFNIIPCKLPTVHMRSPPPPKRPKKGSSVTYRALLEHT